MANLNIHTNILAFADTVTVTSNPKLRNVDWTVDYTQIAVRSPKNDEYDLAPAEVRTLFSGTRTLAIDNTTTFSLSVDAMRPGVYRLKVTAGTAAGFRTDRALTLSTEVVTVTVNNNATASFALAEASANTFAAVQVGDIVFVPDVTTGDTQSPFNVLNVGFWVVLAKGPVGAGPNRKLTCRRLPGETFQAAAEVATVASNGQLRAFSSGPVRAGDSLRINAGFSVVTQSTYIIQTVTDDWVEFTSGDNLPEETGIIPGVGGIVVYSEAKSFVRIETDQPAFVRLNGSSGNELELKPRVNADLGGRAYVELWGVVWQVDVVNRNAAAGMKAQLISAIEAE